MFSWVMTREGGSQILDFDLNKQTQTQVLQGKQVPILRVGVKCMAMEPSCLGFESLGFHSLTLTGAIVLASLYLIFLAIKWES